MSKVRCFAALSMTTRHGLEAHGTRFCAVLREGAIWISLFYAGAAGVGKTVRTDGNTSKGWRGGWRGV
ncbi:MAG: hypothetical protein ACYTEL_06540 [Planctomycetota bacterium]|jgi:hypothetical protein